MPGRFSRTRARLPSRERGSSFSTPRSTRMHQVTRPSPAPPTCGALVLETLCSTAFRGLPCPQLRNLDLTRAFARLSQFLGAAVTLGSRDGAPGRTLCALVCLCLLSPMLGASRQCMAYVCRQQHVGSVAGLCLAACVGGQRPVMLEGAACLRPCRAALPRCDEPCR